MTVDVLIVGGGIVGTSIAYHLRRDTDLSVQLLERGQLTCGTTWHAAGLVAELRASSNLTRLARYSAELYEQLDADGYHTGYRRVGALTLATTEGRRVELLRQAAMARNNGVACHWLSDKEIEERWPHIHCEDVCGGVYMPGDGQTNPVDTTQALAAAAKAAGAIITERCRVEKLVVERGRVVGVIANGEEIRATTVVLTAGLWSRSLAQGAGAHVPVHAAEHFYAVSEPVTLAGADVIVRDPDHGIYLKPEAGKLLVGCFERDAKPLDEQQLPRDFEFDELPFDLEHFAPYMENAIHRVPALATTGIRTWFNGPEGFTPDGRYLLGPSPDVDGLYVACGFNSIGIQSAGGVGQVMARWVHDGHPPMDLWDVDVRRFAAFHNEDDYLKPRTAESLGLLYAMHWPFRQFESARNQRCSPLHELTAQAGAVFGEVHGWERPNWYAHGDQPKRYEYAYGAQNWFGNARAEHLAVRGQVGLFDQSSFAKYEVTGPQAVALLNRLCTADIDREAGSLTYCQWLNERGGIEADVTVTRISDDRFWVVSACASETRDLHWLAEQSSGYEVEIRNITEHYGVLGLMGPQSRAVLRSAADSLPEHFPFGSSHVIEIAGQPVRASRVTYVGTLGWELYFENRCAEAVYQALNRSPLTHAGYHAMDSLRIEKGYRHWGHDITDEDTPLEAGLSFTVAWDKPGGFIGDAALAQQKSKGVNRRLVSFKLQDPEAHLFHDEPILMNGRPVGHITSAAYGHSVGACIGLGYVKAPDLSRSALLEQQFEIEVADIRVAAAPGYKAWIDPRNAAIHA